jgi:2,4-dienoyl-CoA reductase-like NADH-dependent reductase (Old Yellow Enzyme family)
MSLWDVFKAPNEAEFSSKPLLEWFTALDRGEARLSVAGKIRSAEDAKRVFAAGVDALTIGRAAILHHDFPERCRDDPFFEPVELPVTPDYLRSEGLSDPFIEYMKNWDGFVTG